MKFFMRSFGHTQLYSINGIQTQLYSNGNEVFYEKFWTYTIIF